MPNKVFIHAFGCQMNKLDAELAMSALKAAGYEEVGLPEEADVILYNTCSVREHAEERVFDRLPHVDLVCGTREFPRIVELINETRARKAHLLAVSEEAHVHEARDVSVRGPYERRWRR